MKLSLAKLPTPVEYLPKISRQYEREIYVKRDDMTELISSGNKIRKLEFLFADALKKKCDVVFTCGGMQSNHARATAHLAVKLGLKPVLFLRESQVEPKSSLSERIIKALSIDDLEFLRVYNQRVPEGNLLLDKLLGAELITVTVQQYAQIEKIYEEYKENFEKRGLKVYTIPEGGSNALGAMGYVYAAGEIVAQLDLKSFDAIYCAVGSGGTYAGLIAGLRYIGYDVPVVGINVTKTPSEKFVEKVKQIVEQLKEYGVNVDLPTEQIKVVDDFSGPAYAVPTEPDLDCIRVVAANEGIILDPVYTAKTFRGMLHLSKRGQRILFIHTGGLFGLFAQAYRFVEP
ncbi:MAG: D-cysteine desulfhydrase family protein [Pseudothermotoga sp.]